VHSVAERAKALQPERLPLGLDPLAAVFAFSVGANLATFCAAGRNPGHARSITRFSHSASDRFPPGDHAGVHRDARLGHAAGGSDGRWGVSAMVSANAILAARIGLQRLSADRCASREAESPGEGAS